MPSESPFARGVCAERVVRWPGRCAATAVCTNGSVSACVVQCVSSIIKKGVEGWVKTGTLRGLCYRSDRGVRLRCSESCCGEPFPPSFCVPPPALSHAGGGAKGTGRKNGSLRLTAVRVVSQRQPQPAGQSAMRFRMLQSWNVSVLGSPDSQSYPARHC